MKNFLQVVLVISFFMPIFTTNSVSHAEEACKEERRLYRLAQEQTSEDKKESIHKARKRANEELNSPYGDGVRLLEAYHLMNGIFQLWNEKKHLYQLGLAKCQNPNDQDG